MLRLVNHKITKVVIIPLCDSPFVKKLLTFYPVITDKMIQVHLERLTILRETTLLETFYPEIFFITGNCFIRAGVGIQVKAQ